MPSIRTSRYVAYAILALTVGSLLPRGIGAQETELPPPGITPRSVLYIVDTLSERVLLAMTFNKEKRLQRTLAYAQEKLAEVDALLKDPAGKGIDVAAAKSELYLTQGNDLFTVLQKEPTTSSPSALSEVTNVSLAGFMVLGHAREALPQSIPAIEHAHATATSIYKNAWTHLLSDDPTAAVNVAGKHLTTSIKRLENIVNQEKERGTELAWDDAEFFAKLLKLATDQHPKFVATVAGTLQTILLQLDGIENATWGRTAEQATIAQARNTIEGHHRTLLQQWIAQTSDNAPLDAYAAVTNGQLERTRALLTQGKDVTDTIASFQLSARELSPIFLGALQWREGVEGELRLLEIAAGHFATLDHIANIGGNATPPAIIEARATARENRIATLAALSQKNPPAGVEAALRLGGNHLIQAQWYGQKNLLALVDPQITHYEKLRDMAFAAFVADQESLAEPYGIALIKPLGNTLTTMEAFLPPALTAHIGRTLTRTVDQHLYAIDIIARLDTSRAAAIAQNTVDMLAQGTAGSAARTNIPRYERFLPLAQQPPDPPASEDEPSGTDPQHAAPPPSPPPLFTPPPPPSSPPRGVLPPPPTLPGGTAGLPPWPGTTGTTGGGIFGTQGGMTFGQTTGNTGGTFGTQGGVTSGGQTGMFRGTQTSGGSTGTTGVTLPPTPGGFGGFSQPPPGDGGGSGMPPPGDGGFNPMGTTGGSTGQMYGGETGGTYGTPPYGGETGGSTGLMYGGETGGETGGGGIMPPP